MGKIDIHGNIHDGHGLFAGRHNQAPSGGLGGGSNANGSQTRRDFVRARAELIAEGFAPAIAGRSNGTDPRDREGIDTWWDEHRLRAEVRSGDDYLQMPDDYTPKMTAGQSIAGSRRTHRILYEGSGLSIRMPSATAIKRFSLENAQETFDVPVEAVGPAGNPISGFVRVTQEGPGAWSVKPLGMPAQAAAQVGEGVAAILEARRPSVALAQVGDLTAAHRRRVAGQGTTVISPGAKTWITGVGYNVEAGEMVVQIGDRTYGYQVDPEVYVEVATSTNVGTLYNKLVKGSPRVEVTRCERCGRVHNANVRHTCQEHRAPTATVKSYNSVVRAAVLAEAARS